MNIPIKLLTDTARVPTYGTDGAACFDFYYNGEHVRHVEPGIPAELLTGVAVEVPDGHVMLLFSRSGHGYKHTARLANCVGVIDSDYRGEVKAKLVCDEGYGFKVNPGDRIAQGMILPIQQVTFSVSEELMETARGDGGFGSTGS